MNERRRERRQRCYLGARIEYNQRRAVFDCVVRDRAGGGMRILMQGARALPIDFDLVIPDKRETHRARIVWRTSEAVGLATAAEP
jgi:hypothetical protein